jgi:RsiW-degrading membrane proteinase PrsW (M82 family)
MAEDDPVKHLASDDADLYDIATWDRRTLLDRLAVVIHGLVVRAAWATVIAVAFLLLLGLGGLSALTDPMIGVLTLFSAIPAFGLAAYVYYSDTTSAEPLAPMVATFLLGVLTANFAAVVNTVLRPLFGPLGYLGMAAFFFVVVGPAEEAVKLLAVRLYAYGRETFSCVIDGAVYGAMAGLGFATVENSLFIARQVGDLGMNVGIATLVGAGGSITAVRALAGPGHVIYSAIAGYYLGLAKFNPDQRGPIVVKGLLLAAFVHATYNATVSVVSPAIAGVLGISPLVGFLVYVAVYDTIWGLFLFRKLRRYNDTFNRLQSSESDTADETASEREAG